MCDPECRINSDGQCLDGLHTGEIHWKDCVVHGVALFALQCFRNGAKGKAIAAGKTLLLYGGAAVMQRDESGQRGESSVGCEAQLAAHEPKPTGTLASSRAEWFLMEDGWHRG